MRPPLATNACLSPAKRKLLLALERLTGGKETALLLSVVAVVAVAVAAVVVADAVGYCVPFAPPFAFALAERDWHSVALIVPC